MYDSHEHITRVFDKRHLLWESGLLGTLDSLLLKYAEEMEGGPELSGLLFGFSCERPLDFIAVECRKSSADTAE